MSPLGVNCTIPFPPKSLLWPTMYVPSGAMRKSPDDAIRSWKKPPIATPDTLYTAHFIEDERIADEVARRVELQAHSARPTGFKKAFERQVMIKHADSRSLRPAADNKVIAVPADRLVRIRMRTTPSRSRRSLCTRGCERTAFAWLNSRPDFQWRLGNSCPPHSRRNLTQTARPNSVRGKATILLNWGNFSAREHSPRNPAGCAVTDGQCGRIVVV